MLSTSTTPTAVAAPPRTKLTSADYRRLTPPTPDGPRYQLINGELIAMAGASDAHQVFNGRLYIRLTLQVDELGIGETRIAEAKERLHTCLNNLLASTSFREAAAAPFTEVKNVEQFITFNLDDTPVHAVPDLIYRRGDGSWRVVDWKSGDVRRDAGNQAMVYALYLRERHNADRGDIMARIEWLAGGEAEELSIAQSELDRFAAGIRDSVAAMRAYLADAAANAPLAPAAFPLRDDRSLCRYCKFYQLDRDEIADGLDGPF